MTEKNNEVTGYDGIADVMQRAYNSGYDNPRPMHYSQLAEEFGYSNPPEVDMVADSFDLGCRHAQNNVEKFDKRKLLAEMASWGDE